MQPDRPAAPAASAPDRTGLTDRQRRAFTSLGDRLAQLPSGHPSARDYRGPTQKTQELLNDPHVADAASRGEAAREPDAGGPRGEQPGGTGDERTAGRRGGPLGFSGRALAGMAAAHGLGDGVPGLAAGTGDRGAAEGDGLGGRLLRAAAASGTARDGHSGAAGRASHDRAGPGRAVGDRAGWPLVPGAGRQALYRPWFDGSGEPWFSADWAGADWAGRGWFSAAPGRSH